MGVRSQQLLSVPTLFVNTNFVLLFTVIDEIEDERQTGLALLASSLLASRAGNRKALCVCHFRIFRHAQA